MMTPAKLLLDVVIRPTLAGMGPKFQSREAEVMLVAIAHQESGIRYRRQIGADGKPMEHLARGLFQFERNGGVRGVLQHSTTKKAAEAAARALLYEPDAAVIHTAIADNDILATVWARLLLWTLPQPLPALGQEADAWHQYIAAWRPGKPHRDRWVQSYKLAMETA